MKERDKWKPGPKWKPAQVRLTLGEAQFLRSTLRMVPKTRLTSLDREAMADFDAKIKAAEVRSGRRPPA